MGSFIRRAGGCGRSSLIGLSLRIVICKLLPTLAMLTFEKCKLLLNALFIHVFRRRLKSLS
jgi:hypothetical protein